ncbi:glutamate receptor ionotropic, delta-1 [Trichonephila clavipes]|nr:glutamate receptor ionotropic, delta-1 [Trichonephila clavipes]
MPKKKCVLREGVTKWPILEESVANWVLENRLKALIVTRNMVLTFSFPSYDLMIRTDYAFGSIDANGEWTGMIGMLKRNEADLAIGWLSNTYERQTVVDFSSPYLLDANVFVTAAPKILQREYPFINPFQPLVWMYLLISLVLSVFALSVLSTPIGGNKNWKENFFGRWFKEIRRILALFVGQGRYDYYRSTKVRAFMYLWSLSKLVLVFSYLSDVLASLMIPIKESPLKNVQELRDAVVAGKYQFGVFAGTSLLNNLMEAKSGIIKDLANHIRHHPENILKKFADSIKRIEEGKFASMNMRLHFMYSASQIGIERFYVAKDSIGYSLVSIAFRKGFRPMERVNRVIHRITECALYSKIIDGYIFDAQLKAPPPKPIEDKRALSFDDVKMAVRLLMLFHVLSTFCLVIEIGIYKYKTRQERRKQK